MKVTNITNHDIVVELKEVDDTKSFDTGVTLSPGRSVEGNVTNLKKIRRQVRVGENLSEVMPSGDILNG